MSKDTLEQYLKRPGTAVNVAAVDRFAFHVRTCPVCSVSKYAYTRCVFGRHLAQAIDKSDLHG